MKTDSIPLVEHAVRSLRDTLQSTLPMGRIVVQPLPACPDLVLGLINADFPTGPLPPDVMNAVIRQPAYWALCWGSGLGLAQLLYRNPHWVRGRRVCAAVDEADRFDLVLMADVLYDRTNLPLLDHLQRIATAIVVADSRVSEIPLPGFRQITQIDAQTLPNLNEFDEFRTVRIFAYGSF